MREPQMPKPMGFYELGFDRAFAPAHGKIPKVIARGLRKGSKAKQMFVTSFAKRLKCVNGPLRIKNVIHKRSIFLRQTKGITMVPL